MTPLRPFFCYYGGKWRDTPRLYPRPVYQTIIEPFAGSAGYALRYHNRKVVLCDRDPVIVGIWRYLLRVSPSEIRAIPDVALDGCVADLHLVQEAAWLVGFWMNRSSTPREKPSAWMRSGIRPGSFWGARVRETIAVQLDAIRHWRIVEGDYMDCGDEEATWFVDPPYQGAGKHYRHGCDGIDYAALGEWCRSRRGQTIVCENDGATWLPFRPLATTKATRKGTRSPEAIWMP